MVFFGLLFFSRFRIFHLYYSKNAYYTQALLKHTNQFRYYCAIRSIQGSVIAVRPAPLTGSLRLLPSTASRSGRTVTDGDQR